MATLEEVLAEIGCCSEPRIRTLAGPGTGKTAALMQRVAELLRRGAAPARTLVVTFTRTAALDLVRKLGEMSVSGAGHVRAGTLHSRCFALLRTEGALRMTARLPRPLLAAEVKFLVADLKGRLGGVRETRRKLRAFESAWATLQSQDPGWPVGGADRRFHAALLGWLRFHQAMLIGELVPEALRYLRANPLSPHLRRYQHVLVDEYQDLNKAEQALVDLLAEDGTLAVFGDEDQSIYGFKFAHPEGIVEFSANRSDTRDFVLDECRRCPTSVVEMARELISQNPRLTEKRLRDCPSNPRGNVSIVQWASTDEEAGGLARYIEAETRRSRVSRGEILILAPRRRIGYAIRDAIRGLGERADSYFHEEELETDDATERFALLTLLVNPDDRVALRVWAGLHLPQRGVSLWRRLREECEGSGRSPREALAAIGDGSLVLPYGTRLVALQGELLNALAPLRGLLGRSLVDALLPEHVEDFQDLRALALAIVEDDMPPGALLNRLTQALVRPEPPIHADSVRVMSLHKSKGLTADVVIVAGCVQGLIPTIDDTLSTAEMDRMLEEQRRLFFVAMTRSARTLVLSGWRRVPATMAYRMNLPFERRQSSSALVIASQFLSELGPSAPRAQRGDEWLSLP